MPPQLVILDWMMPKLTGPEVCRRIRREGREPYSYVLLLTGKSEKEDIVDGLNAGADDYLCKPFNEEELKLRLRAGRRILNLQAELIAARESYRFQADHDPLTRVWNRGRVVAILGRRDRRGEGARG